VNVNQFISHTLYDSRKLLGFFNQKPNTHSSYEMFLKEINKMGEPEKPLEPITKEDIGDPENNKLLDVLLTSEFSNRNGKYELYSCYNQFTNEKNDKITISLKYPGGETEALKRLKNVIKDKKYVNNFEKPKTSPNSIDPSTTVLSAHLKFGCLSPRKFYYELKNILTKESTKPPVSLTGQLLWRDYFYHAAYATPNFHKIEGNKRCKQIQWDDNDEFFKAWANGKTG
jgi:cryptochrome